MLKSSGILVVSAL